MYYPDRAAQREVNQILVLCPFKQLGCPWQGQLKLYEEHVSSCSYAGVSCPNAGCPLILAASSLDSHFLECEYCIVQCEYCSEDIVARGLKLQASQVQMGLQLQASLERISELELQLQASLERISELELQLQASLASTHNGSFLWRIPEIGRKRRDAIEERITSIYSPPFYTGRNGYKMCIQAYLNGDGIGYKTHLSVFFVLMKGEFDPLLKWPFDYKVSLILVDQDHRKHIVQTFKPTPDSSSFKKPQSDMNVASGCPQFAKLSVLEDESYTKGDVIYLKCIVDTSRIFHP